MKPAIEPRIETVGRDELPDGACGQRQLSRRSRPLLGVGHFSSGDHALR